MRKGFSVIAVVVAASLGLSACANMGNGTTNGSSGSSGGIFSAENIGTAVGIGVGAVAGSMIGGGTGKIVATVIGAGLGGIVGHEIGAQLSKSDEKPMAEANQRALDKSRVGEGIAWSNPDSGNSGTVVIKSDGRDKTSGRYCREFTNTVVVGGKKQQAYGTACRQPDGTWQIVSAK